MQAEFKPKLDDKDGEFWMSEEEFVNKFKVVTVNFVVSKGQLRHSLVTSGSSWCASVLEFSAGQSASGMVALFQQDTRNIKAPEYLEMGFAVYGPCDSSGVPKKEVIRGFCRGRCIMEEVKKELKPGKYLVAVFASQGVKDRPLHLLVQLGEDTADLRHRSFGLAGLHDAMLGYSSDDKAPMAVIEGEFQSCDHVAKSVREWLR